MGRILYGVMGDSGGHISRSLAIARELRAHEIVFVGGGRVPEVMARRGYTTVSVPLLGTELAGQRVRVGRTVAGATAGLARRPGVISRLAAVIRDFDPDLILSDYEYFVPLAARRCGRACISVDRQHALTHCRYRRPPGHRVSRALTLASIRYLYSTATWYVVCSFVPMKSIDAGLTEVFPAVLRELVYETERAEGDHAVVYMRGAGMDWLRSFLAGRRRRYVVYGFDLDHEEGNLRFRPSSSEGFLRDLAGSAYLVSNGGHTAISEALHFGKPVLCVPTRLFYEQLVNAHLLAEAGYGVYCEPDGDIGGALDAFEASLPQFETAVREYTPWSERTIAARLQELMVGRG